MSKLTTGLYEPVAQFRANKILLYDKYIGPKKSSSVLQFRAENMKAQRSKAYSGRLSPGARKRLRKSITLITQACPRRQIYNPISKRTYDHTLSFLTLTVSDSAKNYTSREVYRSCLKDFLRWLTRTKGVKLYVWVAELQKRGQIHYHIVFPDFVPWQQIRQKWNYLQLKAGYLAGFREKYGHTNPNSVDIHSTRHVKDINAYLLKYMSKGSTQTEQEGKNQTEQPLVMDGKIWDCAVVLKTAKYFETEYDSYIQDAIKQELDAGRAYVSSTDHCTIVHLFRAKPEHLLPLSARIRWQQYFTSLHIEAERQRTAA